MTKESLAYALLRLCWMLPFACPSYIKTGRAVLKNAEKLLNYKRDVLSPGELAGANTEMASLKAAIRSRNKSAIESAAAALDTHFSAHYPPARHAGWRENTEAIVVAVIIALGVRTYFLQPFTIPTGSMQPTLNGIIGVPNNNPQPNMLVRLAHSVLLGRTYLNTVAKQDETIQGLVEHQYLRFFVFTNIITSHGSYWIRCGRDTLVNHFEVKPGRNYKAGEPIARGYVNTGDHVFVDKMSYHFRSPHRGDVFVFVTTNIAGIESRLDPNLGSQYYIKRLGGLSGDRMRISPPNLFINGAPAKEPGFQRVMAASNGYRGYGSGPTYLSDSENTFEVPPKTFFALGDNSYNSLDSRYFGPVPEENLTGCGFLVFWPFNNHWGFIR